MRFCIVGAGTMGCGIAQALITRGFDAVIIDIEPKLAELGRYNISKALNKLVEKGRLAAEKADEALKKLIIGRDLACASECDFIIEAILEDANVKKRLFAELGSICKQDTILATNTSSISITEIASSASCPERVVGMHFFNPVHAMKLVEIICGAQTSQQTLEKAFQITLAIGKEPIEVKEIPGFVVNRILIPMLNEAIGVLAEDAASAEDIDRAMMLGANHSVGPLALADLIGLDIVLDIMRVLMKETGDSKYRPHILLVKMVRSGKLGRKKGEGFFKYDR